jgi:hypothetical protein
MATGAPLDTITQRIRVPLVRVARGAATDKAPAALLRVDIVGIGPQLAHALREQPELMHSLNASQFEELVCERLYTMGFEPRKVGNTHRKDGGVDIIFWGRERALFSFLGAAQVKHHRDPDRNEGVRSVRDLAGVVAGHPFNLGLLVTNTSFTPDARWFAQHQAPLLRLRDFFDLRRWLADNFLSAEEWRDVPDSIEVCPGVVIPVRDRQGS